jgi:asparagine synthase (glutamine-hydrolysing)
VRHFLYFGFADHPRTFFRDVTVLTPASYYTSSKKEVVSYVKWDNLCRGGPSLSARGGCPPDLDMDSPEDFDAIFSQSVKHTLVSDVEVGVLLSGGIDSGLIAAEAARLHPGIKAYSLGFPIKSYDETDKAAALAKTLKIPHHVISFDVDWHKDLADFVTDVSDPLADSSLIATRQLCREVSRHHKAVLSGDGADELFAGYELYRAEFLLNRYGSFFNVLRPVLSGLDAVTSVNAEKNNRWNRLKRLSDVKQNNPLATHLMLRGLWHGFSLAEILVPEQRFQSPEEISFGYTGAWQKWRHTDSMHRLSTSLGADFAFHLPGDMLTKVDRASMAYGLEVRVPFLNPRLIRYAFSLPDAGKIGGRSVQTKILLRQKFATIFGKKLAQQKKSGFSVPLTDFFNTWMKTSWPGFGENITQLGLLRPDWKKCIEKAWMSRRFFLENGLFSLLILESWLSEYGTDL